MTEIIEKKHITPIDDVVGLLEFDAAHVDCDLKAPIQWHRKPRAGNMVIMCHDMMGGYHDDRFVDGTNNPFFFNFYHWAQIDIFIYFSHHLITIPPPMWTKVGHKNGIPVLGTFITEWEEGAAKCSELFFSEASAITTAEKLVDIAICYGFDGWLINIENKLTTDEVKNVQLFLKYLTTRLREYNPNSFIIWYDSVIESGELLWQNGLNDQNFLFFENCDGIFLNYTWKDWQLKLTEDICSDRNHDIYVGIDVWARGCVGKFDSYKSCETINCYNMSKALFAPGWVYETYGDDFDKFLHENNKFWELLLRTCKPKPAPCNTLTSNFSYGFGLREFQNGFLVGGEPWFNLTRQDAPFVPFSCTDGGVDLDIEYGDAYMGSTSLRLTSTASTEVFAVVVDIIRRDSSVIEVVTKDILGEFSNHFKLLLKFDSGERIALDACYRAETGGNDWMLSQFECTKVGRIRAIGFQFPEGPLTALLGKLLVDKLS